MRVPKVLTDDGYGPDLPDGYEGGFVLTDDGDYELTDYDEVTELRNELAAMKQRVAAVEVANADVAALRDAVRGPTA